MLPRITRISPRNGSLAGGTHLTIGGDGFGSEPSALSVMVGDAVCAVTSIEVDGVRCRIEAQSASSPIAPRYGERGAMHEWSDAAGLPKRRLLGAMETPLAWEAMPSGSSLTGWFEPPLSGEVSFLLRTDTEATLHWSNSSEPIPTEQLAAVSFAGSPGYRTDDAPVVVGEHWEGCEHRRRHPALSPWP